MVFKSDSLIKFFHLTINITMVYRFMLINCRHCIVVRYLISTIHYNYTLLYLVKTYKYYITFKTTLYNKTRRFSDTSTIQRTTKTTTKYR